MTSSWVSSTTNGRVLRSTCDRCEQAPHPATASPPALLTAEALAELLAIDPAVVRRLVWQGRLPHFKIGRLVRFDPAEIARWLESQHVDGRRPGRTAP